MFRFAVVLACLTTPCVAQDLSVGDVVPDLSALTNPVLGRFEYFGEGRPNLDIAIAPNADFNLEVTIEETGFLDDSVEGQRTRYEVTYTADGWEILQSETQVRCRRGDNLDWQTDRCP